MPTLVLPPSHSEDTVRLAQAALRAKWRTVRLEGWAIPEGQTIPEPVLYGETSFASTLASQLGVRLLEPPLDLSARLPQRFVRRPIETTTLGEARKKKGTYVIQPAAKKVFPKKVYADGAGLPGPKQLPDPTPVLVEAVVSWEWEYRFFASDGIVASYSPYRKNRGAAKDAEGKWLFDESRDGEAMDFVQDLLVAAAGLFPAALVLDVGRMPDGKWAFVDALCPSEAALYGCSDERVLPVIARACGR